MRAAMQATARTDAQHPDIAALAEAKTRAELAEQRLSDLNAASAAGSQCGSGGAPAVVESGRVTG
jgi:hypothetical protein